MELRWYDPREKPAQFDPLHGLNFPEIQNVVCRMHLGCKLDLRHVSRNTTNVEFAPRQRSGLLMRIRTPRATAQVFESGMIRCLGSRNEYESRIAARTFARKIWKTGYNVAPHSFHITNITASADAGFRIDLGSFAAAHPEEADYDPEMFSAIKYKMDNLRVYVQIFASGKLTFLAARSRDSIYRAFELIYPLLREHEHRLAH